MPAISGRQSVHVSVGDTPAYGSPFMVEVRAGVVHAPCCTASGIGVEVTSPFMESVFTIEARDSFGNQCGHGGHNFSVSLAPRGHGHYGTVHRIDDHDDGSYSVYYTTAVTGCYSVSILLGSSLIHGGLPYLLTSRCHAGDHPRLNPDVLAHAQERAPLRAQYSEARRPSQFAERPPWKPTAVYTPLPECPKPEPRRLASPAHRPELGTSQISPTKGALILHATSTKASSQPCSHPSSPNGGTAFYHTASMAGQQGRVTGGSLALESGASQAGTATDMRRAANAIDRSTMPKSPVRSAWTDFAQWERKQTAARNRRLHEHGQAQQKRLTVSKVAGHDELDVTDPNELWTDDRHADGVRPRTSRGWWTAVPTPQLNQRSGPSSNGVTWQAVEPRPHRR